jgi:hypothetical protein
MQYKGQMHFCVSSEFLFTHYNGCKRTWNRTCFHSEFLFTHYNGCKRTWNRTCFHSGILSSHYNGCQRHEIGRAFNRDNMPPRLHASKHVRTSLVVNMCNMFNSSEPGSTSTGCTVHGSDLSESYAMSKALR